MDLDLTDQHLWHLELVEKITKSKDDGKYKIVIFMDIKKAFDSIDYNILLHKCIF